MDLYYDLKKMLTKELEEVTQKKSLSAGDIEIVDKLTHSIKSLICIINKENNNYSYNNEYSGMYRRDNMGRYNDGMYYDDYTSDRGYSGRRYSRDEGKNHMIQEFEKLMDKTSTQEEREIIQSALNKSKNI